MDIDQLNDAIESLETKLNGMWARAESGEQFAEICRIESEELVPLLRERTQWLRDNSQFGVGA